MSIWEAQKVGLRAARFIVIYMCNRQDCHVMCDSFCPRPPSPNKNMDVILEEGSTYSPKILRFPKKNSENDYIHPPKPRSLMDVI